MKFFSQSQRGSTLLIALWALFLLSFIIFEWAKYEDKEIEMDGQANLAMQAKALAHSGVQVALHPGVTRMTPLLTADFGMGRSYHVTMVGEGGKLNINYLLAGEDPMKIAYLKQYLVTKRGLNFQQRETLVDCMLDWVDPNSRARHRLNGATDSENYHPAHRPFVSVDEIAQVKGSEPLVSQPNWKDDFTVVSSGPLDLEAAPADLIALVPGIGDARAQRFVKYRQGQDGIDGTKDDHVFHDINECISFLGLSQDQFAQISGLLSFHDPIVRIHSVGEAAKVDRQVDVVARKAPGAPPQILQWTEK